MQRRLVARGEKSRRFDDHLHAELAPWQLAGIALREDRQLLAVEEDMAAFGFDFMLEDAVDRIVFEQMREGRRVGDIVDGDDFDFFLSQRRAEEHPADSAESVNPNLYRHRSIPPEIQCSELR